MHCYHDLAAVPVRAEIGGDQRGGLGLAFAEDHLVIHAARVFLQVQPAGFDADIGISRDLANRDFAPADAGIGLQKYDRHYRRGGRPYGARDRRSPCLPQGRDRCLYLAFKGQCHAAVCHDINPLA